MTGRSRGALLGLLLGASVLGALLGMWPAPADAAPRQQRPPGEVHEWADRCMFIDPSGNTPATTNNPGTLGEALTTEDESQDLTQSTGYCIPATGNTWFKVAVNDIFMADVTIVENANQTGEAAGGCMEIMRNKWALPATTASPQDFDVSENHTVTNPLFMVTYCPQGGQWKKTTDPLQANTTACVHLSVDGSDPPDRITPLANIDDYGSFDPSEGLTAGGGNNKSYCREGDGWSAGTDENAEYQGTPEGSYEQWSDECVTVLPDGEAPERTTQHPRELGNVLGDDSDGASDPNLGYIDTSTLTFYCKQNGTENWFRVDDAPLSAKLPEDEQARENDPENGSCVVMTNFWADREIPEVFDDAAVPYDFGQSMPRGDYEEMNGRNSYELTDLVCFVNGRWRRGDILEEGCNGGMAEAGDLGLGGFLPGECWGAFPTSNYDIGYDSGAWNHFARKIYGWWTDMFFSVGKGSTAVSLWGIGWAYEFDITRFNQFGLNLGDSFQTNLTENEAFNLFGIAWFFLIAYVAVNVLRNRARMAIGEFVLSFVLITLSGVLLTNRADYMDSTWNFMDKATTDLLVIGEGEDPATSDYSVTEIIDDTQAHLHKVFVEQPYDYINWGGELSGPCAEARDRILARGPHGDDDWPREEMGDAEGCDNAKDFNHDPSGMRTLSALIAMAAALVVGFALVAVALTVVIAKFVVVLLFALAPFAVLSAGMPGGGRRMFWLWLTGIAQAIGAVAGMAFLLALLLLALTELFAATESVSMVERFFMVLLLVLLLAGARRRFLSSSASTAGRMADNLTGMRVGGGGAPWQGPSGSRGMNLTPDKLMVGALGAVGGVAKAGMWGSAIAGGAIATSWGRRRSGKIALRNLRVMERYRERRDGVAGMRWHRIGNMGGGGAPPAAVGGGGGGGGGGGAPAGGGGGGGRGGGAGPGRGGARAARNVRRRVMRAGGGPAPGGGGGGGGGGGLGGGPIVGGPGGGGGAPPVVGGGGGRAPGGGGGNRAPLHVRRGRQPAGRAPAGPVVHRTNAMNAKQRAVFARQRPAANPAQARANTQEARFWDSVGERMRLYDKYAARGVDTRYNQENFTQRVNNAARRYEQRTGQAAPLVATPWNPQRAVGGQQPQPAASPGRMQRAGNAVRDAGQRFVDHNYNQANQDPFTTGVAGTAVRGARAGREAAARGWQRVRQGRRGGGPTPPGGGGGPAPPIPPAGPAPAGPAPGAGTPGGGAPVPPPRPQPEPDTLMRRMRGSRGERQQRASGYGGGAPSPSDPDAGGGGGRGTPPPDDPPRRPPRRPGPRTGPGDNG